MKKIINKLLLISIIASSCGSNQKDDTTISTTDTMVHEVVGIGKVIPMDGIITLSVDKANKVTQVYKKLGDYVNKGDRLFSMEASDEQYAIEAASAATNTAQSQINVIRADISRANIKLQELQTTFEISRNLYLKDAETYEQYIKDSIAYRDQQAAIRQLEQQVAAQQAAVKERKVDVASKQNNANQLHYTALQSGTIISYEVHVGTVLSANAPFGEMAPDGPLIIEGELDEFYADRIQVGQTVNISLIGQAPIVARGTISYVGSSLQNKSIIYETVGEAQDRRVRRFNISLTEGAEKLLINQKVECKIKL